MPDQLHSEEPIVATEASRGGAIFATITSSSLTVWSAKPLVALASIIRSSLSMESYGRSIALFFRPDALVVVVQTAKGFLINYSVAINANARVFAVQLPHANRNHRASSADGSTFSRVPGEADGRQAGSAERDGIKGVQIRFRMVIRIDAGVSTILATDYELLVATTEPAALQCIHWVADNPRPQTSTELVSNMPWFMGRDCVVEMVHDRPMNLTSWITKDGRVLAVQRRSASNVPPGNADALFKGFCFRQVEAADTAAVKTAINARFSLIAVGCRNGAVDVYNVKDYMGNIPFSHSLRLPGAQAACGKVRFLSYSPDGYCLVVGYERGWAMWSVYGKLGANSFTHDPSLPRSRDEVWLHGIRDGFWVGGGCELALVSTTADTRIFILDLARNSLAGCYSSANICRGLAHTSASIMVYAGHDVADLTSLRSDASLWQTIQIPSPYLSAQWPIKAAVISPDGKYVAVAGRRGLAHYSIGSGRWKTFDDVAAEQEFAVRGGMCWHQHWLIACVEASDRFQVRVYSRDKALSPSHVQCTEDVAAPVIFVAVSGADSLLVYTHDNVLRHWIIVPTAHSLRLIQVGQIGFHGIIRAPPRVRSISWVLPEGQIEHGDPSQDVATASVLFLVDGKLVLLQPSMNELGELKYDMRVIAQSVEFYFLLRDQPASAPETPGDADPRPSTGPSPDAHCPPSLRDSLWYFDGAALHVWSDVHDVMARARAELGRELPPTVRIPLDFYPLTPLVAKGVVAGVDLDLVQRCDVGFSFFRLAARTQLFLPHLLQHLLAEYNSPAALHLCSAYLRLPYFAHALEVLLHDTLDAEVDATAQTADTADRPLLPSVLAFLASFPSFLDVVLNCTRKTELRSWKTLFAHLPPPLALFEQALLQHNLPAAAGYLLVVHTLRQGDEPAAAPPQDTERLPVHEFARLLQAAVRRCDWRLCREVARFLVGIDDSGDTLRAALQEARLDASGASGSLVAMGGGGVVGEAGGVE